MMKHFVPICILLLVCSAAFAQHTLRLSVRSSEDNTPLNGATVVIPSLKLSAVADTAGLVVFADIPAGRYVVNCSFVGYQEKAITIEIPRTGILPVEILLEPEEEEEEEVLIMATRTSRTIRDIPTRVETISGEELSEKGNMKPGDIRMLLNESTGIQTQQTSATSYNSSIRIQGLDGRYTQILRDGFPLYAGLSGGLSLMQVAPLDLKQIEVIKGSSSTLYGGGAIAGLVNLVSKTPTDKKELSFLANGTSAGGLDLSGFFSKRFSTTGLTVFASRNSSRAYDPADIGLSAIPEFERYTVNPRFFIYGKRTNMNVGGSYIRETRTGGSMDYIRHGTQGYYENNNTERFTGQLDLQHRLNERNVLNVKSSFSSFHRRIAIPLYEFEGRHLSTYSEINFTSARNSSFWIIGLNVLTDQFRETRRSTWALRDYQLTTYGVFAQHTWKATRAFSLESGIRVDHTDPYGFQVLPRVSVMVPISPSFTARLGGGFGYKSPTVFNEESERVQYRKVWAINRALAKTEQSIGGNLDFNYRTTIGELGFTMNHLFFYTRLNKPLVMTWDPLDQITFYTANGHIDTKGMETNLRLTYHDFKLFVGYTYADVTKYIDGVKTTYPLTARHRLNHVLMYEREGRLKIGLEAYYFSPQTLSDGLTGKSYWIFGLMAEKSWKRFSLFVNFENFTDTRQTRFDTIYTGPITNPRFRDIYAPVDGFVVNGGIKARF